MKYKKPLWQILDDISHSKKFISLLEGISTKYPSTLNDCGECIKAEHQIIARAKKELTDHALSNK